VLELDRQDARHLDARPGRPRDRHQRIRIRLEDLDDVARRDGVSRRRQPIAGDEHTVREPHREDRGPVRNGIREAPPPGGEIGHEMSVVDLEKLEKAGALIAASNQHCFPLRKRAIA
jgi:hypothetical protein